MMSPARQKKRKLLDLSVNRVMQLRMIGKISLILFVSNFLCGLIYFYFSNQQVTSSFKMFHVKAQNFLDFLLPVVIAAMLISLIVGVLASLFFPRPIAGGLYRIEEDLKRVRETGDLTVQIRLRDGDQVTEVARQINILLDDLRERIMLVQIELDRLDELSEKGEPADVDMLKQIRLQLGTLKI